MCLLPIYGATKTTLLKPIKFVRSPNHRWYYYDIADNCHSIPSVVLSLVPEQGTYCRPDLVHYFHVLTAFPGTLYPYTRVVVPDMHCLRSY